jgi:hypothetical protein
MLFPAARSKPPHQPSQSVADKAKAARMFDRGQNYRQGAGVKSASKTGKYNLIWNFVPFGTSLNT